MIPVGRAPLKNKRGKGMKKSIAIVLMFFLSGVQDYSAHPHVFMETGTEFVFNENELEGFNLEWVFDEMFSSVIMEDCDRNKDGEINGKELKVVEKDYFANLEEHNYFCHIMQDGNKREVKKIERFNAYMGKDKRMVYKFFVPMKIPLNEQFKNIKLSVYDDTYYIAVGMSEKNAVHVKGIAADNVSFKCVQNSKDVVYYGQIVPTQIILNFKK